MYVNSFLKDAFHFAVTSFSMEADNDDNRAMSVEARDIFLKFS
jgi:hypothetical protein